MTLVRTYSLSWLSFRSSNTWASWPRWPLWEQKSYFHLSANVNIIYTLETLHTNNYIFGGIIILWFLTFSPLCPDSPLCPLGPSGPSRPCSPCGTTAKKSEPITEKNSSDNVIHSELNLQLCENKIGYLTCSPFFPGKPGICMIWIIQ